jgi:hypothetical protein
MSPAFPGVPGVNGVPGGVSGVSVQRAIGEACAGVVGVAQAIGSGAGGLDDLRGRLSGALGFVLCCVSLCV